MMKRTKTPMTGAYFAHDIPALADVQFEILKMKAARAGAELRAAREQVEVAQKAYDAALNRLCVSYDQRKG